MSKPTQRTRKSHNAVVATELRPGMVLALPFGRSATIKSVRVGRVAVYVAFEDSSVKTSFDLDQEVLIEVDVPDDSQLCLVCEVCDEAFDSIETAGEHEHLFGSPFVTTFRIVPYSEL